MSDGRFSEFCSAYPDFLIEMTAGTGIASDPSTGFVLPNGARRAPDAAWTARSRLSGINAAAKERFWQLCPDFVIELRSHTDRLPTLRANMHEWIENGAQLAWLIERVAKASRSTAQAAARNTSPEWRQ